MFHPFIVEFLFQLSNLQNFLLSDFFHILFFQMSKPQMKYAIVITKIQTNQFISSITISTILSNKEESPIDTEKNCFLWKVKIKKPLEEVTDVNNKIFENIPLTPTLQKILKHSPEAVDAANCFTKFK